MRVRQWGTAMVCAMALAIGAAAGDTLTARAGRPGAAQAGGDEGGRASIQPAELRGYLSYISSDDLNGRRTFSEGLGLAAAYISDHLRQWGVKPAGDDGLYLQRVVVQGVKSTSHSTVTVTVNGRTRTFKDGAGIELPKNVGRQRTFTADDVEFLGYGLDAPLAKHDDYAGRDVSGKVVVWLGAKGPAGLDQQLYRRALFGRSRFATEQENALAAIGPELPRPGNFGGGDDTPRGLPKADFTTTERLDHMLPPTVTAKDDFLAFVFSASKTPYAQLKAKAAKGEPLPSFRLTGVTLTFHLDDDYEVVRTRYTHNVVGVIDGSDPTLKSTYVAFGAHYDHVGYAQGEVVKGDKGPKLLGAVGRVTPGHEDDRIWNGADDDGSGTVTLLSIAKAYALGPKPKRSLLFVWHAGEEEGLWGSRYYVDHPEIPLDKIVAQLNMDMVGRNRDNKASEANTVYIVGSDRISTELHNLNVTADRDLSTPLTLDYEMNDPTDLEQVYYRSDHYSYAKYDIPIIFFTTGLHPDYHANTDSLEKIQFDKMARIGRLIYQTGWRVANLDHAPVRDNKGPRAGKGFSGMLPMGTSTGSGGR